MRRLRLPTLPLFAFALALTLVFAGHAKAEPEGASQAAAPQDTSVPQGDAASQTGSVPQATTASPGPASQGASAPQDTVKGASTTGAAPVPDPAAQNGAANPNQAQQAPGQATGQPAAQGNPAGQADTAAASPPPSKILIEVDKSTQLMSVSVDGVEKYEWPVSTGRLGYSTPSGTYTPTSMNEMWYSKQWDNSPMPHAIFFMKDGHAIHGSHEVRNLGKPASHGCVRISPANAAVLYDLVKQSGMENTQVVLTGETPGGEAKVAAQPAYPRYADDTPPWAAQGQYYNQPRRRGLFGRLFQPSDNSPHQYYRRRGFYPPGY